MSEPEISIDQFLDKALQMAKRDEEAKKILEATKNGYVKSDQFFRRPDAAYDQRIREMATEVIFGVWNKERRDAKLLEIFLGVQKKIRDDIDSGEWPKVWTMPSKRTVDRRVNELASSDSEMWGAMPFAPCICLKAGHYQVNPALFEESVKADILS